MRHAGVALLLLAAGGCAAAPKPLAVYAPPVGINQVLQGKITATPGHSLIIGDLNMTAGAEIPRHYHHGEEYIYMIGGSATFSRAGQPDVTLGPGEGFIVAPGVVHWGKAGPQGMRAISAWVKDDARPLRETVAP